MSASGPLLTDFEANRSGTRSYLSPFERMHEEPAFFLLDFFRDLECHVNVICKDKFCAVGSTGIDASRIGRTDHDYSCAGTNRPGGKCGGHRVIACTDCRHSCLSLLGIQAVYDSQRSPRFERAGVLQELEFCKDPRTGSDEWL